MAVAVRSNGLHHAVSLGAIEVSSKGCSNRNYDSEDESSKRRLRHTSSTELYPRTSIYSKGDIREQYCLTDRQLNSIERPRRDRFFGCLSRRSAHRSQSFLGVCVGRRAPSDENLTSYAPFQKYPRYHTQHKSDDFDRDNSYFRRQPASILSTGKMTSDIGTSATDGVMASNENRPSWITTGNLNAPNKVVNFAPQNLRSTTHWLPPIEALCQDILLGNCIELCIASTNQNPNPNPNLNQNQIPYQYRNDYTVLCGGSSNCPAYIIPHAGMGLTTVQPTTPRTKHVSFARSHTLTSFNDVNLGFNSLDRLKAAQSQERLIGGKKSSPAFVPAHGCEQHHPQHVMTDTGTTASPYIIHQHPHQHPHQHQAHVMATGPHVRPPYSLQAGHSHQHHHLPVHIHQLIPTYNPSYKGKVQTDQPIPLGVGVIACAATATTTTLPPQTPEIFVVEKKFRNAMKTQATQTDPRKDMNTLSSELSPRNVQKVKVVSQGAQTNGIQNKLKMAKDSFEIPNIPAAKSHHHHHHHHVEQQSTTMVDDMAEHFSQSMDSPTCNGQNNIEYYERPSPPQSNCRRSSYPCIDEREHCSAGNANDQDAIRSNAIASSQYHYESQSLPRKTSSNQYHPNEFESHSLPRHYIESAASSFEDSPALDFTTTHLLPPPLQYCKDSNDEEEFEEQHPPPPPPSQGINRRKSLAAVMQHDAPEMDSPFRRDDIRRQSMPVFVKTERLIDGHAPRSSFRAREKFQNRYKKFESDEKEILIDFKPHMSPKPSPKLHIKHRKAQKATAEALGKDQHKTLSPRTSHHVASQVSEDDDNDDDDDFEDNNNKCAECSLSQAHQVDDDEMLDDDEDAAADAAGSENHLYENVPSATSPYVVPEIKRDQFRKRSVSLDDAAECVQGKTGVSSPPSPCREDIANASTYPSSDSLANDLTRDHSDGIWNESQATVLTAEHHTRDPIDSGSSGFLSSNNHHLTPSSKRKNLLLQHQQRSSVDTDALDCEEQLTDYSPIYSNISQTKSVKAQTDESITTTTTSSETSKTNFGLGGIASKTVPPAIAITPIQDDDKIETIVIPEISINNASHRQSQANAKRSVVDQSYSKKRTTTERPNSSYKFNLNNTDISECSTNTDDYVTCTDTSKRTQGIKTPPTTTSSSSTTQVPVSTQSSQMDKSHGSSFESASSLHSSRGEMIPAEDPIQQDEISPKKMNKNDFTQMQLGMSEMLKKSPTHSTSSSSSESYEGVERMIGGNANTTYAENNNNLPSTAGQQRDKPRPKIESISDDERSELRYSSSGYYESPPHDDVEQNIMKSRRYRTDDERKRRKTSMKLDIEKENMRALTSPIRKPTGTTMTMNTNSNGGMVDKLIDGTATIVSPVVVANETSPNKMKRFRPKVRRQLRKSIRDDSGPRRQKSSGLLYGNLPTAGNTEKLLDCSIKSPPPPPAAPVDKSPTKRLAEKSKPIVLSAPTTTTTVIKSASEGGAAAGDTGSSRLKAKSTESLRSVSPGSDSVFYSEATDGHAADQLCQHCGKEVEGESLAAVSIGGGDSVESIPYIENEEHIPDEDIVKPPSDFADSPVITKTTQRLYKKMDRRFRSEERGRHYKTRQDNIRAKSEERNREQCIRSPQTLRPSGSSPCVLPDTSFEQNQQVIYRGHYDIGRYARLTDADVWAQLDHQSFDRHRERRASTESERSFHSKYQVVLHRLVQRRCTLEMYHRQKNNEFELISSSSPHDSVRHKLEEVLKLMLLLWARESYILDRITNSRIGVDKTILVKSDSGEFGFRIHGSKPVVVAAIEPDTPAESSGLEVGDIIISVNGIQVLDKHHTEVVKIAHDGCETLELKVARTIGVLMNEQHDPPSELIYSGYLWRQSGQAKGQPNAKKWVRRWFCLRSDNCLYYYKTEGSTQPVGAMIMAKHIVEQCSTEVGKPYAFKVDSGEGIPLFVAGDSEELSNTWIKVLRQAAAQANPWLDNCARYLYQQPSSVLRPDCFGYLLKLGSRWCGWSKRYCVLKNACLYFYQDKNSKAAFGMACLHGYKVATMSTNASGKKHSFEIIPPESKLRHYYFCAESEMDKKRWVSALEYSIDRWIKSG